MPHSDTLAKLCIYSPLRRCHDPAVVKKGPGEAPPCAPAEAVAPTRCNPVGRYGGAFDDPPQQRSNLQLANVQTLHRHPYHPQSSVPDSSPVPTSNVRTFQRSNVQRFSSPPRAKRDRKRSCPALRAIACGLLWSNRSPATSFRSSPGA